MSEISGWKKVVKLLNFCELSRQTVVRFDAKSEEEEKERETLKDIQRH